MKQSISTSIVIGSMVAGLIVAATLGTLSNNAIGYPVSTTSLGANPIVSTGGTVSINSVSTATTAPPNQDLIITDVVLGVTNSYSYYCEANFQVVLTTSGGASLGNFVVGHPNLDASQLRNEVISLRSGLRVPANESVQVAINNIWKDCGNYYTLNYTLTGYLAQP